MLNEQVTEEPLLQQDAAKKKKKKDKVRSAWISFAGRIVAQIVGAVATVALGVAVLHKGAELRQPKAVPASVKRIAPVAASRTSGEIAVAVLPLENFSGDPAHDYLADGMTEILTADLAKIGGLRVISRTSSMHFKGQRQPLRDMADQLGAQWIIEGSVVRAGERIRITAQLIDAGTDQHVWAETYERAATDLLGVQAEVASAIASAVSAALPSVEPSVTTAREVAARPVRPL